MSKKNKSTKQNSYGSRYARRVSGGRATIALPVDRNSYFTPKGVLHDQPTLNTGQYLPWLKPDCKFHDGQPVLRNFSRLHRADEL